MNIQIHYQKITDTKSQFVELKPEEYFDPLEDDETFEADGIARFISAEEYLNLSPEELEWTDIRIQGTDNDYNIRTEYYKGGHSMWHSKDSNGNEEMCVATQVSTSEMHIVRMSKSINSNWQTVFNILSKQLEDGSGKETKFV